MNDWLDGEAWYFIRVWDGKSVYFLRQRLYFKYQCKIQNVFVVILWSNLQIPPMEILEGSTSMPKLSEMTLSAKERIKLKIIGNKNVQNVQ